MAVAGKKWYVRSCRYLLPLLIAEHRYRFNSDKVAEISYASEFTLRRFHARDTDQTQQFKAKIVSSRNFEILPSCWRLHFFAQL